MIGEPARHSIPGALQGLLVAENKGDILDEVFTICDAIGLPHPEEENGSYAFTWIEEES